MAASEYQTPLREASGFTDRRKDWVNLTFGMSSVPVSKMGDWESLEAPLKQIKYNTGYIERQKQQQK